VEGDFIGTTRYTAVHVLWQEVFNAWTQHADLWAQLGTRGLANTEVPAGFTVQPTTSRRGRRPAPARPGPVEEGEEVRPAGRARQAGRPLTTREEEAVPTPRRGRRRTIISSEEEMEPPVTTVAGPSSPGPSRRGPIRSLGLGGTTAGRPK
jgi:hypothetical protein